MSLHELIVGFWLWMGPTDEPVVNMVQFLMEIGLLIWIAIPLIIIMIGIRRPRS